MKMYLKKTGAYILFLIIGLVLFYACKPQEELFTEDSSATLSFSEDAVVFDTIFTDIPTVTKRLRVYNRNKKAVRISDIYIGGQTASPYKILVNGDEGINFNNLELFGGDSLLILVSATLPVDTGEDLYLAYDSIVFNTNNQLQNVKLISWGQDVNVIRNDIACDAVWTKGKPYLLYDSVLVKQGCTLTIEEGTQIFAFNDAIMHVKGTMKVNGTIENRVEFRGFRKEPDYEDAIGQWQGLAFYEESQNNELDYATIKNAQFGIIADKSSMVLNNAIIQNMSLGGIFAFGAEIYLRNSLISNCLERLFQATEGGTYELAHCTLANYEFNFSRKDDAAGTVFVRQDTDPVMNISLYNNIFWGSLRDEVILGGTLNVLMLNNIFRSQTYTADFLNGLGGQNMVNVTADSLFTKPSKADFTLPSISPAVNKGTVTSIVDDLLGKPRDGQPDIGAYERQ